MTLEFSFYWGSHQHFRSCSILKITNSFSWLYIYLNLQKMNCILKCKITNYSPARDKVNILNCILFHFYFGGRVWKEQIKTVCLELEYVRGSIYLLSSWKSFCLKLVLLYCNHIFDGNNQKEDSLFCSCFRGYTGALRVTKGWLQEQLVATKVIDIWSLQWSGSRKLLLQ